MLNLREIHKPKTLDEALEFLKQPGTVALAGGTELIAGRRKDVRAVVDLSELGLAYIREQDGAIVMGATTTLAEAAESPTLRAVANGVVSQAAHRSAASVLRNQATVVGTLIAEPAGILAAVLVALEATVTLTSTSSRQSLSEAKGQEGIRDFLTQREELLPGAIVTEVAIPATVHTRRAAVETVARTPSDRPIVSTCAALEFEQDLVRWAAIALGGVGETVARAVQAEKILVNQALSDSVVDSAARAAADEVDPPSDFRGSAEYRREMVKVLTARTLRNLVNLNQRGV